MMRRMVTLGVVLAVVAGIAAFNAFFEPSRRPVAQAEAQAETQEKLAQAEEKAAEPAAKAADAKAEESASKESDVAGLEAHIDTSKGMIVIKLLPEVAPATVANFANLAQRGYYDGLKFHRVIPNFMIQGGCPLGTGTGGPGYKFKDEFNKSYNFTKPGILAMANAGPATNGSQFFITHVPTPHLNQKHTIFGELKDPANQSVVDAVQGGDTIKKIEIKGDTTELYKSQEAYLKEWNAILDSR